MKKVYEPLNMIMNGRYAVLYGKLAPELQRQVLATIGGLIEEDKEYADKGNYGHLCVNCVAVCHCILILLSGRFYVNRYR